MKARTPRYLRSFADAARAITDSEPRAPAGGQRFVGFEDLSVERAAEAAAQFKPERVDREWSAADAFRASCGVRLGAGARWPS